MALPEEGKEIITNMPRAPPRSRNPRSDEHEWASAMQIRKTRQCQNPRSREARSADLRAQVMKNRMRVNGSKSLP